MAKKESQPDPLPAPPLGIDDDLPTSDLPGTRASGSPTSDFRPPVAEAATDVPTDEPARIDSLVVMCPYCDVQCKANRTEALFTRYYCPTVACNYSQKVPRPDLQKRLDRRMARDRQQEGFGARD